MRKTVVPYSCANKGAANQPAHLSSLIRIIIICLLYSIYLKFKDKPAFIV